MSKVSLYFLSTLFVCFRFISFLSLYVVFVCRYVEIRSSRFPLELKLQTAVSCLVCVPGLDLGPLQEQSLLLTAEPSLWPLLACLKIGFCSADEAALELTAMYMFFSLLSVETLPCLTFSFLFLFLLFWDLILVSGPGWSWTHNTLTPVTPGLDCRCGHHTQPLHLFCYLLAVTFSFLLPLLTCVPLKAKFLKFFRSFFPTDKTIHNNLRTGLNLKHQRSLW